ncbi:hypothetical protein D9757_014723 [Collybiopsis confluens]|uniref:Serine protease inhibitor n=1 Tax=Collybiopsis confluens TaxID=2823264 RepID=A0A8H5FZ93_9AGAR|nr:hypothetical protein D9757_014723 [Collybiopsis confluens]
MDTLSSGTYFIRNLRFPVSRFHIEDKSLNPKAVYTLPEGAEEQPWNIERVGDGYILSNPGGAPTAAIPHKGQEYLFALLNGERPTKWKIESVISAGFSLYVIKSADDGKFWVSSAPEHKNPTEENQIEIKRLILQPVEPPRYPPEAVFEIVRS